MKSLPLRRGLSLMELLLVLTVLSVVVAISWPALRRPLNRSHVQSAAQQLQRDLLTLRRAAMESGTTRQFQYRIDSGTYYCGTHLQVVITEGAQDGKTPDTETEWTNESADNDSDPYFELPVGTTFVDREHHRNSNSSATSPVQLNRVRESSVAGDESAVGDDQGPFENDDATDTGGKQTATWSRPLRFYPSGRMESLNINLTSDDGYQIMVAIEGLAGRVKIYPLERIHALDDSTRPEKVARSSRNSALNASDSEEERP